MIGKKGRQQVGRAQGHIKPGQFPSPTYSSKNMGPIPASFLFIRPFLIHQLQFQFQQNKLKKCRWCAWDSNPGPQDCRCRQNHGAMAAARTTYSFVDTFHFDLVLTSTMTKDDNAVKCNSCPRTFSTPQTGLRLHTNNEHPEPQKLGPRR